MAGEWLAQLPEDLRANEAFTGHATLGEFAKAHLEAKGKLNEFDGKFKEAEGKAADLSAKLTNTIPKLGEKATDEEKAAFYKALGRPEKSEEYEFPKGEGVEHDPAMVAWARDLFHRANLSKEQGSTISKAWDAFMAQMATNQQETAKKARDESEAALKKELGDKYPATAELAARLLKDVARPEEVQHLADSGIGNDPILIRLIARLAAKTGEDSTTKTTSGGGEPRLGMIYDKSPAPPSAG